MLIKATQIMITVLIREFAHSLLLLVLKPVAVLLETYSRSVWVCCSRIS
uniref:Uncharacterized protein n=1 Tax=Physcomitrium patens TaxID=3218 RepID=A0A2K1JVU9_PHYPA|nr:hypothetical protein PHYPA_015426 [Physcomitrium patens]